MFPGGLPSTANCFVFPRRSAFIQHEGRRRFLADPTLVTFYNRGDVYRRFPLSDEGDHADWFALAANVLLEAVRAHDPRIGDTPARPFRFECGPSDAAVYLDQRRLLESLARNPAPDGLATEEAVFRLLDRVLARSYTARGVRRLTPPHDPDCAELARAFLAQRFREPLWLSSVASAVGVTVPHLCRCFRRRTGRTLSAYRQQLRLRASLERVAAGDDLSALALDLGFSSHSHFSASFRRVFGVTPSDARGRPRGRLAELSQEIDRTLAALN